LHCGHWSRLPESEEHKDGLERDSGASISDDAFFAFAALWAQLANLGRWDCCHVAPIGILALLFACPRLIGLKVDLGPGFARDFAYYDMTCNVLPAGILVVVDGPWSQPIKRAW